MADETQTLDGNEGNPQTPGETGKMESPESSGDALTPEDAAEFQEFREIKKTTGLSKFTDSAKEALRLKTENDRLRADLTEKELKLNNPGYEDLTEAEKENRRIQLQNQKDILEIKAKDKWNEDYKNIPSNIKALIAKKGGEEAFKAFACTPENRNANLQTLAKAFVFDAATAPAPPAPKTGLENAGGHQPVKPVKEGYTADEAAHIRKTNPAFYEKLIREKRLKIVD